MRFPTKGLQKPCLITLPFASRTYVIMGCVPCKQGIQQLIQNLVDKIALISGIFPAFN